MALSYKNDEQQDERLNPARLHHEEDSAAKQAKDQSNDAFEDIARNYDKDADDTQENANIEKARQQEENPMNYSSNEGSSSAKQPFSFRGSLKGKGPIGLILLVLGGGGGLLSVLFGTGSMIVNLMENLSISNDSSSTAMERRLLKVFGNATSKDNALCKSKKLTCKMGRMSNNSLRKLAKKGVTPLDEHGKPMNTSRLGYPDKNPTYYEIDGKQIAAKDIVSELSKKENSKLAYKVMGRAGAFNMRFRAWVGKTIKTRFYDVFGLKREGGLADGSKKKFTSIKEKLKAAREKIKSTSESSGSSKSSSATEERVKEKINGKLGAAKKGGAAYTIAAGGCLVLKAPKLVAGGVAAIQLAQLLPIVMDTVLSPGGKEKATGIDNAFTPEDVDTVGSLLTAQSPDKNGKMKSALDSPYLQSAMGVNTNKPAISKDYTPGYSVFSNPIIRAGLAAEKASEPACNIILSPAAMYTAAGIEAGIGVWTGGIGFIVKWAVSTIAAKVIAKILKGKVLGLLKDLAKNTKIPEAVVGEPLGDVLGISAAAFFSAGSMARNLPALKQSQLASWTQVKQDNETFNRDMEVASLSPFDTSSRYTFLGSMVYNADMAMAANMGFSSKFTALFSSFKQLAFSSVIPTANAALNYTDKSCGYAKDFYIDSDVAVNMAGLPCTGLTEGQAAMPTDAAIKLLSNEGWLDLSKDVPDGATVQDLMDSGVIKSDNPLHDYVEQCGDASSGDYVFNSPGCTIDCTKNCGAVGADVKTDACPTTKDTQGNTLPCNTAGGNDLARTAKNVKDPRSLEAIPVFLLDFQILQSMNGEDDEDTGTTTTSSPGGAMSFTVSSFNMCQEINHKIGDPSECDNLKTYTGTDAQRYAEKRQREAAAIAGTGDVGNPQFDIVGGQEVSQPTQAYILSKDTGYESFPSQAHPYKDGRLNLRSVPSSNGKAIFWNTSKFSYQNGGFIYDVCGNGSSRSPDDDSFPWTQLQSTAGQTVYVVSAHFPNDGYGCGDPAQDRKDDAQKILDWAKSKATGSNIVIVTGDLNNGGNAGSQPYCVLTAGGILQHAKDLQDGKNISKSCPSARVPIDHIYASTNITGLSASGWTRLDGGDSYKAGTDHSPAWVTYNIAGSTDSGIIAGPSKDGWVWPVPTIHKLGILGYDEQGSKGIHKGIDIGPSPGAAQGNGAVVVAAHDGVVNWVNTSQNGTCGNYISITATGTPYYAAYQHLAKAGILVHEGETVKAGQPIAKIGTQGGSTCGSAGFYHLHFSIESHPRMVSAYADPFPNGTINPLLVLPKP